MENKRIKVLIGDDSASNGVKVAATLMENDMIAYTRKKTGKAILDSIINDTPDVVILDLTLQDTDAICIMEHVKGTLVKVPAFIVISEINNSFIERQVIESGASYFLKALRSQSTAFDNQICLQYHAYIAVLRH